MSNQTRQKLVGVLREYIRLDLRWSYLAIGVLIVIGAIINLCLANEHGWTVWPFVGAAGFMMLMHEAAQRNGQGIPPLHVYAFFGGTLAVWLIMILAMSVVNPFILIAGCVGIIFYGTRKYLIQRQHDKMIEARRANGRCIHCGEIYDPKSEICENCGGEPNPEDTRLARVAAIARGARDPAKARAALTRTPINTSAKQKEQALLARARKTRPQRKI